MIDSSRLFSNPILLSIMRILFLGDVVGKSGRNCIAQELPQIRRRYSIDCVIANGENATHGFGLSQKHFHQLIQTGIDFITLGNHTWDSPDIINLFHENAPLIRPHNYPEHQPGTGIGVAKGKNGEQILVLQVAGMIAMMPGTKSPFDTLDEELPQNLNKQNFDAIVVDVHAEFTAEKNALGHFVDGRASLLVGTHTHVPTADHRVMPGGTAYITDVGMCGDYHSVIGFDPSISIQRQRAIIPKPRLETASNVATLCGVIVQTDPQSAKAISIQPIRIGGVLSPELPQTP
jgi:hypothetical protein